MFDKILETLAVMFITAAAFLGFWLTCGILEMIKAGMQ